MSPLTTQQTEAAMTGLKAKAGERMTQEQIYTEYRRLVRSLLMRLCHPNDADDLMQQVFLKAFRELDSLKSGASLRAWICQIAINTARDDLRHRLRNRWLVLSSSTDAPEGVSSLPSPEATVNEWELIHKKLPLLSSKLQDAVVLHAVKELDLNEISLLLNIPVGTVKSRLSEARRQLRLLLAKE